MGIDRLITDPAAMPVLVALAGTILAGSGLALLRRSRFASRVHDQPNHRSLHETPVPRIGGLALTAAIAAAALVTWRMGDMALAIVFAGGLALSLVSLADDVRPLPSAVRLACHLGAGLAVPTLLGVGGWQVAGLAIALAWSTNLYNFMDGADGLAGSMATIGFGTCAIAAALAGDPLLSAGCALIAGVAVGFLAHNLPPARMFMGDAGSIPLGFLAGAIGWLGIERRDWPVLFPLIVFLPFWLDATATLARRIATGQRFWQAHRQHFYQRLVLSGAGHRTTLVAYAAFMLTCAVAAMTIRDASPARAASIIGILLVLAGAGVVVIERRYRKRVADDASEAPPKNADRDHL